MKAKRTNQEWLDDLRGLRGADAQKGAVIDLANFLYVVAYNYVVRRQQDGSVPAIRHYVAEDLEALAEDYAQDVLMKLLINNCARLERYSGLGSFTGWVAVVIRNHIASTLRLSSFQHGNEELERLLEQEADDVDPTKEAALREIWEALQDCINRLIERRRRAFIGCYIEDKSARTVAAELGSTEGAVNLLVMHAKRNLRACMDSKGLGPEILDTVVQ